MYEYTLKVLNIFFKYFYRDNTRLITLELQGNILEQVEGPFLHSKSLMNLYMANSHLRKLSPQFFANISNLAKLDLSGNPLRVIEPTIFNPLSNLKHLILNNCNITHIVSGAFSKLGHLSVLELARNNFENNVNWTLILGNLHKLEYLELSHSSILNLPENMFVNNTLLRNLVLAENKLLNINVAKTLSHNLVNLEFLDLGYCQLKGPLSQDTFVNTKKLHTLILSGNNLSSADLVVALSPLLKLVKVSLSDCGLIGLPSNIFQTFTSLQELDISRNPLNNVIAPFLSSMESLEYLDIGYSNLSRISKTTLSRMPVLKTLILSGNKHLSLEPGLFENFGNLEVLELNNCGIVHINDIAFQDLFVYSKLEELRISGNHLQIPEKGPIFLSYLSNLRKLDMSRCNLSYLPDDAFITTSNITQLLLNDNKFKNDKNGSLKFLKSLTGLKELDLSFNNLTSINSDNFDNNKLLVSLNLVSNPWKCDCYIDDILEWAMSRRNVDMLVGFKKSTSYNVNYNKTKGLVCNFDPNSSPMMNVFRKLRRSRRLFSRFTTSNQRTWARHVFEGYCSYRTVDESDIIITTEVHLPSLNSIGDETKQRLSHIMSLFIFLLVVLMTIQSILIMCVKKIIKKKRNILNYYSRVDDDTVQIIYTNHKLTNSL